MESKKEDQVILMLHFQVSKKCWYFTRTFLCKFILCSPAHRSPSTTFSLHWGQVPGAAYHWFCAIVLHTLKLRGQFKCLGTHVASNYRKWKDTSEGESCVLRWPGSTPLPCGIQSSHLFSLPALCASVSVVKFNMDEKFLSLFGFLDFLNFLQRTCIIGIIRILVKIIWVKT